MSVQTEQSVVSSKVLVLGLGLTGASIAGWLARQQLSAVFMDSRDCPPALARVRELLPDADIICGEFPERVPEGVTEVLVSPGLSMSLPLLQDADDRGLSVRSDIDLFVAACTGTVLGVTGSNGKSTVTALIECMLNAAGVRAVAGGNLGTPALDLLNIDADYFVLELSSFQLERSAELPLHAAVILNMSVDHLDHHGDLKSYAAAKACIYHRCGTAVVNRDEPSLAGMIKPGTAQVGFGLGIPSPTDWGVITRDGGQWIARGSLAIMPADVLQVSGRHNLQNVLAAFALADTLELPLDGLIAGAQIFAGLPHRMQVVSTEDGICWVNDSKATNEAASLASIASVEGRLILIAGGDAKGGELHELAAALAHRDVQVIAIGKDRDLLVRRLTGICDTQVAESLSDAVGLAARAANKGDTVLLAPACSSLDMFHSYAERGDCFAQAVQEVCQ
ncbi:MAG: UDP-N-acetylmuramoyl-L-alanine--D-glutamate ligase [Gammaproteobacteria bacterium]|nr:UDP-N-acetylmuramoyl-L-alanine--D-glutamate ligase [Gammaproteobacteria bacterium]MCP4088603.1 UDP-N-acetylmuramoyl-L-alanine--D-glutamate ligase [Gammaproteobacteria bacterium]MCP4276489.1 UDP-N-acetylmuramoyl-L-alanine--D-glutamate ligase [Gammaproteobacteria bacterium]MCP4929120.1 UDP-N-acetylmuramoyl-L-alanine--D-glutamate ligase [Gammaproteobacteria bacterium]